MALAFEVARAEIWKNLEEVKLTELKVNRKKYSALNDRVRKLQARLARSVPRIEHEAIIVALQLRITDLETKLRESRSEANALQGKVARFESLLGQIDPARETTKVSL